MALALENADEHIMDSFADLVIGVTESFPLGTELMGEDIRKECLKRGIVPHHPNAWGGAISAVVRSGLLDYQGHRAPRDPSSHASRKPYYARVEPTAKEDEE